MGSTAACEELTDANSAKCANIVLFMEEYSLHCC